MITHFRQIKVTADEIEDKLDKLAQYAKTLNLAIKSSFSIDYNGDMVDEVHIDIVPVEFEEEIKC